MLFVSANKLSISNKINTPNITHAYRNGRRVAVTGRNSLPTMALRLTQLQLGNRKTVGGKSGWHDVHHITNRVP
uniref:Uncharacterized protein n=1 Tax=Arion vulgaris TaxID=1028688 RepID=A0A0B7BTJ0_9EUPU